MNWKVIKSRQIAINESKKTIYITKELDNKMYDKNGNMICQKQDDEWQPLPKYMYDDIDYSAVLFQDDIIEKNIEKNSLKHGFFLIGEYEIGKLFLLDFGLNELLSNNLKSYLRVKAISHSFLNNGQVLTLFKRELYIYRHSQNIKNEKIQIIVLNKQ